MNTPTVLGADVVIIGAGPGGSAAAIWAARSGYDVLIVDEKTFPRDKTCGDGLTPRAIAQLYLLGLQDWVNSRVHHHGLHLVGFGQDMYIPWPETSLPHISSAVPRRELDETLRNHAQQMGVRMCLGVKVIDLIRNHEGAVCSIQLADSTRINCSKLIVADGARSPIGRLLGRYWHRNYVHGVAGRAYVTSPHHDEPWMSSQLELSDPDGQSLPGYGWIFPLGNGMVNIGVGTLSTPQHPAKVSLRSLLSYYVRQQEAQWEFTHDPVQFSSALLPMGGSVSGIAGKNWILIGDAAGCINPLNGEGIDYALETGHLGAQCLSAHDFTDLWPQILSERYGRVFSLARRLGQLLAIPRCVPTVGPWIMRSQNLMSIVVRVMGNLVTPDDHDYVATLWKQAGNWSYRYDTHPPFWESSLL